MHRERARVSLVHYKSMDRVCCLCNYWIEKSLYIWIIPLFLYLNMANIAEGALWLDPRG